jgi:hypothetical protein
MVLFASDDTERGEWLPRPPLGDGDRERDSYLRASCRGVEGTELECCETTDGRCKRWSVMLALSRFVTGELVFRESFGVMLGALVCTQDGCSLCPSGC